MNLHFVIPASASLVAVLFLTPAARSLARRFSIVAAPRPDRWHTIPTPMLGGVPIFIGFSAVLLLTGNYYRPAWGVLLGSACIFALGLVDDVVQLSPFPKLVGCLVASGFVLASGLSLPWFASLPLNVAVTILWLVGITNAMNLLDGLDGLAGGIALIAGICLALSFFIEDKMPEMILALVFAGAVAGFLFFNFSPASIFMGDCGSMFLGFFLASLTLMSGTGRSRNLLYVMAGPVLPFLAPIFDTTFVTISRLLTGRRISQGGRDHTFYRLAKVAGSERNAVLIFYGFAIISGILSLLVRQDYLSVSFALIPTLCLILVFWGAYLGQVKVAVYAPAHDLPLLHRFGRMLLQNGVFQAGLDSLLILLSYYSALLLRTEGNIEAPDLQLFLQVIPWFIVIKLAVFIGMGAYRHLWRYFGMASLLVYAKSIALSSTLCMLVMLFVYRFSGFSRAVFVIDAILLLCLIAATRMSFQIFHATLRKPSSETQGRKRALIYGASPVGSFLAKELEDRETLGYLPIGFIDDDLGKHSRSVNGYRVFADIEHLESVLREHKVEAVLIAGHDDSCRRLREVEGLCEKLQVPVKRLILKIE
jgi:UDP-GlcNAc:undecaprenyl-phosphate/decaprenyl-phosphate GlcNAc-1-phosphate transferase